MVDFWRSCGFHHLNRDADGRLVVTDDFLRSYLVRPELHPVEVSCDNERALHRELLGNPHGMVDDSRIAAIADEDARENYRNMLHFASACWPHPPWKLATSRFFMKPTPPCRRFSLITWCR